MIDPGDDPARVIDAVGDAAVAAIVPPHSHFDHVLALPEIAEHFGSPTAGDRSRGEMVRRTDAPVCDATAMA